MSRFFFILCMVLFWCCINAQYTINKNTGPYTQEANYILQRHRTARNAARNGQARGYNNQLLPAPYKGSYIETMEYSDAMAQSALEWGTQICENHINKCCACGHSANFGWKNSNGQSPGENMGCGGLNKPGINPGSTLDQYWNQMINQELAKYSWPTNAKPNGQCNGKDSMAPCRHYTQVIWGDTTEVGCAVAQCSGGKQRFVCHYMSGGNFRDVKPYSTVMKVNDYDGPLCCQCADNGVKGKCGETCLLAVKARDSWCYQPGAWDKTCRTITQDLCAAAQSGGPSGPAPSPPTTTQNTVNHNNCLLVSGVNSVMNGQWKKDGSNINGRAVYKKDGATKYIFTIIHTNKQKQWTMKNNRKHTGARNKNYYCTGTSITQCSKNWMQHGNKKTDSKFEKKCNGALKICGDGSNEAVCIGTSLLSSDWNVTYRFAVDPNRDGCSNGKPVYHHMVYDEEQTEDVLYRLESVKDSENDFFNGTEIEQWHLTKHYMKFLENATFQDILVAVCNKSHITECSKYEWDINDEQNGSLLSSSLRDWLLPQILEYRDGVCSDSEDLNVGEYDGEKISTSIIIAISMLIAVLIAICILFYFCVYKKGKLQRKGQKINDSQMTGMREDDGCAETNDMETIEVETQIETEEMM